MNLAEGISMARDEEFKDFLSDLEKDLGRGPEDLEVLKWAILDRYLPEIEENLELFGENEEVLNHWNGVIRGELKEILQRFESIEEYEKCSAVNGAICEILPALGAGSK